MITADPKSELYQFCLEVANMRPGENWEVDIRDLAGIEQRDYNGATFNAADRILGNIAGSAYTHSYRIGFSGRTVIFTRHEDTGELRYTEPDRR